jgi:hypothetical protein
MVAFTNEPTEDELRQRFRKVSDEKLREYGEAAKYMCSPEANFGQSPRECYVRSLKVAREVWAERHPNSARA